MTANCAAWVRAAPSERGNQVTRATTPVSWQARGVADTLPDGLGTVNRRAGRQGALEVIWTAGGGNDGSTRWQGGGGDGRRDGHRPCRLAGSGRGGRARGRQRLRRERRRQPAL